MVIDENLSLAFNEEFYDFIKKNIDKDVNTLRLKNFADKSFDVRFAITQIECNKKASHKIPEILHLNPKFLFPSTTVAEQCTSETIAKFHASLFHGCRSVLDMTAGLCVDSYYISRSVTGGVTALEIDKNCAQINTLNMNLIASGVSVICCDSADYIMSVDTCFDAVFIDPARRGTNNSRVYALSDCSPDVITLLPFIKEKANFIIIKASPMLDITHTLSQIDCVSDVWIIGYKNECKELLLRVDFINDNNKTEIHTINFESSGKQEFSYFIEKESHYPTPLITMPKVNDFLYEPNCCIMKSGAFSELNATLNVSKLHNNTHLFISEVQLSGFPGREFIIEEIIPFKDKLIKKIHLKYPKINTSVRNFKLTAEQLKVKLKVNDGGDKYLFGVTIRDNSLVLLICSKPLTS